MQTGVEGLNAQGVNNYMEANKCYLLPITSEMKLWISALCSALSKPKQQFWVVVGCIDESTYRKWPQCRSQCVHDLCHSDMFVIICQLSSKAARDFEYVSSICPWDVFLIS